MTSSEFQQKIKRVLITEEEIQEKIKEVGEQISQEYEGKPLLLVSILMVHLFLWLISAVPFTFHAKLHLCAPKVTTMERFHPALSKSQWI